MEGYEQVYPKDAMLFMDFRRHHTGLYDGTASRRGLAGAWGEAMAAAREHGGRRRVRLHHTAPAW